MDPFLLSALVQKRWNNLAITALSPYLGESLSSTTSMSAAGRSLKGCQYGQRLALSFWYGRLSPQHTSLGESLPREERRSRS